MKKIFILIALCAFAAGCKNDDGPALPPGEATLTFPVKDELCTQGTTLSSTQSSITFKWTAAANADSYELGLKNLLTGIITTQVSSTNQLTMPLDVNTPYAWSIISRSSLTGTTAQSDVWKFYNSGPGTVNYAPFPADIIAPIMGQVIAAGNGKVTLDWNGVDTDNDALSYDVYFGTTATPAAYKTNLTESALSDVAVTAGTTYYWKVVTRDTNGNTSDSGVYQFTVN